MGGVQVTKPSHPKRVSGPWPRSHPADIRFVRIRRRRRVLRFHMYGRGVAQHRCLLGARDQSADWPLAMCGGLDAVGTAQSRGDGSGGAFPSAPAIAALAQPSGVVVWFFGACADQNTISPPIGMAMIAAHQSTLDVTDSCRGREAFMEDVTMTAR